MDRGVKPGSRPGEGGRGRARSPVPQWNFATIGGVVGVREPSMNEHVKRPGRTERTEFGLKLTDPEPLPGIPAVWRFAALISTVAMGFLAFIAALYLGRAALLPVVAA